jgi:hypothetical protein
MSNVHAPPAYLVEVVKYVRTHHPSVWEHALKVVASAAASLVFLAEPQGLRIVLPTV